MTVYKGLFLGILLYGAAAWADLVKARGWRKMASWQRRALLKVLRAYKTAPTVALPVMAGVLPVRLEAWKRWAGYRFAHGLPVVIPRLFDGEAETFDGLDGSALRGALADALLDEWQREWDASDKGRLPHKFIPSIRTRLNDMRHLNWTHELTQVVLGHGEFAGKLGSFNLMPLLPCICGEANELAEHVLVECGEYADLREMSGLEARPRIEVLLETFDSTARLQRFADLAINRLALRHAQIERWRPDDGGGD